jgi:TRAP-type C4-dicarboxylate transport system substrate-binding protein
MKMSKIPVIILVLCLWTLLLSLTACGGGAPASTPATTAPASTSAESTSDAAPEPITLRLAHGLPLESMTGQQYNAFCERLEEVSGGSMKVEQLVGGSLLDDTQTLDGVMNGTVDFIHSMVNYASGVIPDVAPLCVPGYYSGEDYLGFAKAVQGPLETIFADFNIKYLGSNYQGESSIVCGPRLVKAPADMKGLAFRSSGTWLGKAIEAWGASATTIGLADLTTALERGTVQGTCTGWVIAGPYKLYEVAKNVTFTNMAESFGCLLMNMDTWNSLSDRQKAWVEEARDLYIRDSYDIGQGLFDGYAAAMEDAGASLYTLAAEEKKVFTDLSLALYDEIEPTCTEKGVELIRILNGLRGV